MVAKAIPAATKPIPVTVAAPHPGDIVATPTVPFRGDIVDYTLDGTDVAQINEWRNESFVKVGEIYPMIVVRVENEFVSGSVVLGSTEPGAHSMFSVEASQGDDYGEWQWLRRSK